MPEESSLTIEETNKLRLSLGLKPLNVGSQDKSDAKNDVAASSESQEQTAVDNLNEKRKAEEAARRSHETQERLRKARERAERDRKLRGKTLAEDDEEEDTLAWIRRTKSKPQTVIQQPMQSQAVKKVPDTYSTEDLRGLRVGHDLDEIESGNDVVLTLKDGDVLDDDAEIELVNTDMTEKEALKTKLNNKKRKSVYTTYEDDEYDETTGQKKILARYDEDIDSGPKKNAGFVIDAGVKSAAKSGLRTASTSTRVAISLDDEETPMPLASDYAEPIVMKKKSKQKKSIRRRRQPDDEETHVTQPEKTDVVARAPAMDNFVDDDDLQASLARQRRLALQKRAVLKPEDIIATFNQVEHPGAPDTTGVVLDENAEFVRSLQDIQIIKPRPKKEDSIESLEEEKVDTEMPDSTPLIKSEPLPQEISTTGIDDEAILDSGVGAAMKMLRQKGILHGDDETAQAKLAQEAWLAKNKRAQMDLEAERRRVREELRNSPRYRNMPAREREALAASENRRLDALEAKAALERFKDYRPTVDIKYVDDFGRNMSQKEAFKHMSHQFHGKESGSGKTAKKLAQIEKEKASEQKSIFK